MSFSFATLSSRHHLPGVGIGVETLSIPIPMPIAAPVNARHPPSQFLCMCT